MSRRIPHLYRLAFPALFWGLAMVSAEPQIVSSCQAMESRKPPVIAEALLGSDVVFVGRLLEKASAYSRDGRYIQTRYRFEVEECLKGSVGSELTLTEYGGQVGNVTLTVSHSATYQPGRRYLIFSSEQDDRLRTSGGFLGRFPVVISPSGKRLVRFAAGHPLASFLSNEAGTGLVQLKLVDERLRRFLSTANTQGVSR